MHHAGFVCLIGRPNAGKSTLLNAFLGQKLVITSHKSQTTRHRIFGLYNDDDTQIVFSDTPGLIEPDYELHKRMMSQVDEALRDSDLILWIADVKDDPQIVLKTYLELRDQTALDIFLVINKVETPKEHSRVDIWKQVFKKHIFDDDIFAISALHHQNTDYLLQRIKSEMPESPPFYDKENLAVAHTKFFISELIRETIFEMYDQEIPYQSTVIIDKYVEHENKDMIHAQIVVSRETQKGIIIGSKGSKIKQLGIESRKKIEEFLDHPADLFLQVKVRPDWRNKELFLNEYGY